MLFFIDIQHLCLEEVLAGLFALGVLWCIYNTHNLHHILCFIIS
jgi:hypothetical protein